MSRIGKYIPVASIVALSLTSTLKTTTFSSSQEQASIHAFRMLIPPLAKSNFDSHQRGIVSQNYKLLTKIQSVDGQIIPMKSMIHKENILFYILIEGKIKMVFLPYSTSFEAFG